MKIKGLNDKCPNLVKRGIDVEALMTKCFREGQERFEKEQTEKRTQFHERINAAFVLKTSVQFYLEPMPTDRDMEWLAHCYPKSTIERGNDQGATYMVITPDI